jgi:hypothetical protein
VFNARGPTLRVAPSWSMRDGKAVTAFPSACKRRLSRRARTKRVAEGSPRGVLEVLLRALRGFRGEIWFIGILQCATFDSLVDAGLGSPRAGAGGKPRALPPCSPASAIAAADVAKPDPGSRY